MNSNSPEVSIIVRTRNEELWIAHCLSMIFEQDFDSFEVILVDNSSTDFTLGVANRYPLTAVLNIDKFFPGKALNDGIRASSGKYIVCISAHCIPKNDQWLKNLHKNFSSNKKLAGVYGRQLPLAYTSNSDKRDLLITFGRDKKIQEKDYFFHNANSMLSRAIWEKFPFDENVTNIEDRVWGKEIIEAGYQIAYDPTASVYHYHGLHHHEDDSDRAQGIASILNKVDIDSIGELPESLKPDNILVASVLLVKDKINKKSMEFNLLLNVVKELNSSNYVDRVYILCLDQSIALSVGGIWIDRNMDKFNDKNINIETLLSLTLEEIECQNFYPETILYVNHHYPFRPENLFDNLITEAQYKGCNSVFACFVDYGHYWQNIPKQGLMQIDSSMDSRNNRSPIMRALYGLGCATSASLIRIRSIVGGKIGIFPIDNYKFTLNSREMGSKEIINNLLANDYESK